MLYGYNKSQEGTGFHWCCQQFFGTSQGGFKKAIVNGAKCIITVHNHPGGKPEPSCQDLEIWKKLKKSGEILGIEVMDNIILTPSGSYYSENTENCINR